MKYLLIWTVLAIGLVVVCHMNYEAGFRQGVKITKIMYGIK